MTIDAPPIYQQLGDEGGKATIPWVLFFNGVYEGDAGNDWTPTFQNLTQVGTPTITGRYYQINQNMCYFWIRVVPGTSTTSTAGTTYINNFPITFAQDGACLAVSGLLGANAGMIDAATNRIYPPGWSAVTVPVTIVGINVARGSN